MTPAAGWALAARASTPRWYAHGLNRAGAYRWAARLAALLPRPLRLALAAAVGQRVAAWLPAERAAIARAVARIAPAAPPARHAALVRAVFRHFAMCFADLVATNRRARHLERLVARVEGAEHLERHGARGLVVLTAHVGNWELGARLLARRLARPTHVVVAAEADPGVERFLRGGPAPVRFVVAHDPTAVLGLVAALRRGDVVALQGDRALGTAGDVGVPFFGVEARFPLGPFVLARAAGVPVLPSFCLLERDRRYAVVLDAPIRVDPGGERRALARWVQALEACVARHPEQWFNFYDLWDGGARG